MISLLSINVIDSDHAPAWMELCCSATPGNQDSGRCRWVVGTQRLAELCAALDSDSSVIAYEVVRGGYEVRSSGGVLEGVFPVREHAEGYAAELRGGGVTGISITPAPDGEP